MANDEQPALKQTLGFWQIAFYGLGSMLGAGIYALIGRAHPRGRREGSR